MTPFTLRLFHANAAPTTRISATSTPIPAGQRFVVEHVSGYFAVGTGWPVDKIWIADGFGQEANLPTHFESRELNFGGTFGIARYHQFGTPVRMYVDAGLSLTVTGDANIAGEILAVVLGELIPL